MKSVKLIIIPLLLTSMTLSSAYAFDFEESLKSVKDAATATASEIGSKASDFKDSAANKTFEKTEDVLTNLYESLLEINKVGFKATEINVEAALLPKVIVQFDDTGSTGKEADVLNDNKDNEVTYQILKLLISARKFRVSHYKIEGYKVTLGVPPKLGIMLHSDL